MGAQTRGHQGVALLPFLSSQKTSRPFPGHAQMEAGQQTPLVSMERAFSQPFLEKFSRKCISRWLAEASGHGDFLEYHARFNHSPKAIKECPCGGVVSRGHFFSCPLTSFNNPLARRLDPRAFWSSFQLFVQGLPGRILGASLGRCHRASYLITTPPSLPPRKPAPSPTC